MAVMLQVALRTLFFVALLLTIMFGNVLHFPEISFLSHANNRSFDLTQFTSFIEFIAYVQLHSYQSILSSILNYYAGMLQAGGQGGQLPPRFLADQKAPPGSGGAPHYYLPPQIFRLCNISVSGNPYYTLSKNE